MIEVVTVRFGPTYGPVYANRLYAGVRRHLTAPHRFTVFTDDPAGLHPDIHAEVRPDLGTWWNQLWVCSGWTDRRQMGIDVDDVVVGSLDALAAHDGHLLNSDVYHPADVDAGFQVLPPGAGAALWAEFQADPAGCRARWRSPKEFYIARINDTPRVEQHYPGQWVSYKVHCQGRGLPPNARIVGFHGLPKPADVPDAWLRAAWVDPAWP